MYIKTAKYTIVLQKKILFTHIYDLFIFYEILSNDTSLWFFFSFLGSSSNQDGTSSATSTSEIHSSSQNIEDQNQDEIFEKLQVIDELLLNDNFLFPPEKCIEFNNNENHMLFEEVYEEYFQLVYENSCHF